MSHTGHRCRVFHQNARTPAPFLRTWIKSAAFFIIASDFPSIARERQVNVKFVQAFAQVFKHRPGDGKQIRDQVSSLLEQRRDAEEEYLQNEYLINQIRV